MKAVVFAQYGAPEVLQLQEIEKPSPKDHEVLIKIYATGVSSGDSRLRRADPFAARFFLGLIRPRLQVLGGVFSGVVEAVGQSVTRFKAGDEVFGKTTMRFGAYAEYLTLPESGAGALSLKPSGLSHEEAAALPFGGCTALHFLKKANVQKGQKVLVYGASGAVGSAAVQIAKYMGAEVTAVCSAANAAWVKSIGADYVMDYRKEDFSKNGIKYDVVFEAVGKSPVSAGFSSTKQNGVLILAGALFGQMMQGAWYGLFSKKKVIFGVENEQAEGLEFLKTGVETGHIKPLIDKVFPLEQMAAAHKYVDGGHKKGNVAITVHHV